MAKTGEPAMSTKSNGASPPAQEQPAGIMGRLGQVLRPRPRVVDVPSTAAARRKASQSATAPAAPPQRPPMSRVLFGAMAYFIGSILLQYVLVFSSQIFKLHLERPQALFPRDTPFLGAMSTYSLLYVILLVSMVWALFRFNIIPRNIFGPRTTPPRNAASGATASNGDRSSAARRRASGITNTAKANATNGSSGAPRAAAAPPRTPATGENDETYERVKSLQRSRRRKR